MDCWKLNTAVRSAIQLFMLSGALAAPQAVAVDSTLAGGSLNSVPPPGISITPDSDSVYGSIPSNPWNSSQGPDISTQLGLESFCRNATEGKASDISFKFFDPAWHYPEWESAKKAVLAKCQDWETAKQDSSRILGISMAIHQYANLSTEFQDKLVAATIERLGPARNQKSAELCFAFATADIASYLSGKSVSAFSTAVRGFNRSLLDHGPKTDIKNVLDHHNSGLWVQNVLRGLFDGPVCTDDQPRESPTYSAQDLTDSWQIYTTQIQAFPRNHVSAIFLQKFLPPLHRLAPSLDIADFVKNINPADNMDKALSDWINRKCSIKAGQGRSYRLVQAIGGRYSGVLDNALDAGALPVISYQASILQKTLGGHASLVVAKATIQGNTFYLVRNSWDQAVIHTFRI